MRPETSTAVLAFVGGTAACLHGDALYARGPGPSLDRSSRYVPALLRRQNQQDRVNIFFGQVQNVGAEIYGCYAGGSDDADKIPKGIQPKSVSLNGEGFDPNLNLGVMVYYIKASQNSVVMFDTSTAKALADSCNQQLKQQTGLGIDKVILSHEHGDHVAGLNAESLKQIPVVAQDSLVEGLKAKGGDDSPLKEDKSRTYVPLKEGESKAFQMQDGVMNVTNVQAHTQLGTVAMINGVALMGDELESTVNFLVSKNTQQQSGQLQKSNNILGENNVEKVLPAHGSGAAMFGGQFSLQLLQSNQQYLELMATNPQSVCGNQQQQEGKAQLAQQIGIKANDITDAYFDTHINENCKTVGAQAGQAKQGQNGNKGGGGARGGGQNAQKKGSQRKANKANDINGN
ncbi:metallo-beta-lactamase superfamily protein [Hirsutella rhossiliensis]|uniref:Metallo-beta-lactamase superfamily domain-containing protein n=1 Tax=Hirsutella rhossiliensis TaxID=111463 RepID=A0A9P8SC02_9HYPO|nr:metallo-beta-lactamase superfamily domain-containing protein [Hirsutella rhossiliensis]KAH0957093.1 metallo-beta-lactamase superfamily domain-containing protein [Hirsutella rhossiliensis]